MLALERVAQPLDLGEVEQEVEAMVLQTSGVVVDDALDRRQAAGLAKREQLVDLLLILRHDDADLGVLEHVMDLVHHAVGIKTDRHAAERLRRELRDHPFRPVVPEDGEHLAALQAE